MICPVCGSENVTIEIVTTGTKGKKMGKGAGDHALNTARAATALCTFGVSNIFWKKRKGNEKHKYINEKVCLCQKCGNSWTIE